MNNSELHFVEFRQERFCTNSDEVNHGEVNKKIGYLHNF